MKRHRPLLYAIAFALCAVLVVMSAVNTPTKRTGRIQGLVGSSNYYVRTTGSDSTGDGSSGNPWRTPGKACATINASTGGTLYIGPGTYTGTTLTGPLTESNALQWQCNINHFRMTSENTASPAHLTLSSTQGILIGLNGNVTDVEIDHLYLDGGGATYVCSCVRNSIIALRNGPFDASTGVPSDIRIHHNTITGARNQGIFSISLVSNRIDGVQITDNVISNNGDGRHPNTGVPGPYDHGLYLESMSNLTIARNTITGNSSYGVQMQADGSSGYNSNVTIEGNTITGNGIAEGGGIYVYGAPSTRIVNNLITGNGEGIRLANVTSGTVMAHNTIVSNTLTATTGTNTKYGVYQWACTCNGGGISATYSQNIIQSNTGAAIFAESGSTGSGTRNVVNGSVSAAVSLSSGTTTAATFTSSGVYTLASGSSAINLGTTLSPAVTTDILGNARDATPDAGAYEYGGTPPASTTSTTPGSTTSTVPGSTTTSTSTIPPSTTTPAPCLPTVWTPSSVSVTSGVPLIGNLTDGNEATVWYAGSAGTQVVTLDLGTTRTVSRFYAFWAEGQAGTAFTVRYRAGTSGVWLTPLGGVVSGYTNASPRCAAIPTTGAFTSFQARQVQIIITTRNLNSPTVAATAALREVGVAA